MRPTNVICRKFLSDVKNFTDGKMYPVHHVANDTYELTDDFGVARVVMIGQPSSHLPIRYVKDGWVYEDSSGWFEPVK